MKRPASAPAPGTPKVVGRFLALAGACVLLYSAAAAGVYLAFNDNLPDIDAWSFQPKRVTRVYSADGKHLKDFLEENREILAFEEIPQAMHDALLAIEDQRFYSHWGIDTHGIFRAAVRNLLTLSLTSQGASTITQQLARNLFPEVGTQRSSASLEAVRATYARKIREQITAVQLERLYTKQEILTMYLNTVFFGHTCYGLKAAARYYFNKDVAQLGVSECALLAGVLKAPNRYSPFSDPAMARTRRNQVLANMVQTGKLSRSAYRALQDKPVVTRRGHRAETYGLAPYFIEYVRQRLEREYGSGIYRDGVTVHTTLDSRLQRIAEKHYTVELKQVQERVDEHLRRFGGSRRPDSAVVQAAFIAMDPATGRVLALIGGRDFAASKFNRATQALRQAGSAFKPFVYTAAIDNNRFPIDVVDDNAVTIWENGRLWGPENYDRNFLGPMTLREALKQSRNLVAVKLADEIGPGLIRRYARTMGISSRIDAVPSLALGTCDVYLLDLVGAYAVFPNKGVFVEPMTVTRITSQEGDVLFEQHSGPQREVLRPGVAVVMMDMMRAVVDEPGGTAYRARTTYGLTTAAAGKTGTTNEYTDAWFVGFTPHLVAGVWVGLDDPSLRLWEKQSGAVAALPLWARFMEEVYRTVEPYRSRRSESFDYPGDLVVRLPVCQDSHRLATRYCPHQTTDLFLKDEALPSTCPIHGGAAARRPPTRRF
ncbi:MAG: PBP1A family penicillin-binding protein [Candidatus Latescibacterota bacterium]